ncbi:MAG: hypothetical protein VXW15_12320 [Bdellovibrionota bacterium]|nr:hypothetical protein [Bdellovibrionota bacterium]
MISARLYKEIDVMVDISDVNDQVKEFSSKSHGSSELYREKVFVKGENGYIPLKALIKKIEPLESEKDLQKIGFVFESYEFHPSEQFSQWFQEKFSRKLARSQEKNIAILYVPDNSSILDSIEQASRSYETLREKNILINGKNLPVQLGEWYAKCVFGLKQKKSTSQRGFDFLLDDSRVEVKVSWGNTSPAKGVKIKKTLVQLSDLCIVIYLSLNFKIREICILDSDFIIRKISGKGHTIFLKDVDIAQYFFSKSSKHIGKVSNSSGLLRFSTPELAMRIAEMF